MAPDLRPIPSWAKLRPARARMARTLAVLDDLAAALVFAAAAALLALADGPVYLRLPYGLLASLILPGYALTVAAFPRAADMPMVDRVGAAVGLAFTMTALLALGLDRSPWGLGPRALVIATTALTIVLLAGGTWRRLRLSPADQFGPHLPSWRALGGRTRTAVGILIGAAVLSGIAIGAGMTAPATVPTDFYVLGPEGLAEGYPRSVEAGETISLRVGVANRRDRTVEYTITVLNEGILLASDGPFQVPRSGQIERNVAFAIGTTGTDRQINVLLHGSEGTATHRRLRLWLDVGLPSGA